MIIFQLESFLEAIVMRRKEIFPERALLVGISGIDGSGKGFVTNQIAKSLGERSTIAIIGVDGWLNLPHVRFAAENCGEHFYRQALRLDTMFKVLVLPLRDQRSVEVEVDFTDETAPSYRRHRYEFHDIDIILLEGIFLFKRQYHRHFDLTCWVDCSFATALARAVKRGQEGLSPEGTVRAFEEIYFPAQRVHLRRDNPRGAADFILPNDTEQTALTAGELAKTSAASILLPRP